MFKAPSIPAPVIPPTPAAPIPMPQLSPQGQKPSAKGSQPTFIASATAPTSGQAVAPALSGAMASQQQQGRSSLFGGG